jgi:Transposase protein
MHGLFLKAVPMPQMHLPLFADGATRINDLLSFVRREGQVTYFHGVLPVFVHDEHDVATFRMITAQFCVNGNAQQADIARAFGVTGISVKRAVKRYRAEGPAGFYQEPKRRGAAVLTAPVLEEVQHRLDAGQSRQDIAHAMGLKKNTLDKALRAGRLHQPRASATSAPDGSPADQTASPTADTTASPSPTPRPDGLPAGWIAPSTAEISLSPVTPSSTLTSKSQRSTQDSQAEMGMGTTNLLDRVAASLGLLRQVSIRFEPSLDVTGGGVLLAVPALLACGLLRHTDKYFRLPPGYYGLKSIFLLLAFMALSRLKSVEQLRYCAPGEWGKLLGLDRVPEVRTLRAKIAHLVAQQQAAAWSAELSQDWMQELPPQTAVFCVDGHVRVYHGEQTELPRHYVARQKLCLRATTDYWVNALDGRPFFLINQAVDPGLLKVLEHEIIPRLKEDAPHQTPPRELEANSRLHRFTVIFDREGYSPAFLRRMKEQRIACLTYHKFPGADWPADEFSPFSVPLASSGQTVEMDLAERGLFLAEQVWLREIRKRSSDGHQTPILATDFISDAPLLAGAMFSRWSQENFFRYMREHYALDRLVDYSLDKIPETTRVVNPTHRRLDGQVRKQVAVLNRKQAEFGSLTLDGELEGQNLERYEQKKATLLEEIQRLQAEVNESKVQRKAAPRHIPISELPQEARFQQLSVEGKQILDTIKMIAYRAETALVQMARERLTRPDDARQLVASLFQTDADFHPDENSGTLTVRLHHSANHGHDEVIRHLCAELNATEATFPETNLRLVYELGAE